MVNLKDRLNKLYDASAAAYESKAGHAIPANEDALWGAWIPVLRAGFQVMPNTSLQAICKKKGRCHDSIM